MDTHLLLSLGEALFTLLAVFIAVGQAKQKAVDQQESIDVVKRALLTLEKNHADSEKDLQRRIYECREESIKHGNSYVTREEFFNAFAEIRSDIKRLIGLVSRQEDCV